MKYVVVDSLQDSGLRVIYVIYRCVSLFVYTRKLFESSVNVKYPSVQQLLDFVQFRAEVLELSGETRNIVGIPNTSKAGQVAGPARKGGEYHPKIEGPQPTSLATSKSNSVCQCCAGPHS